MKSNGELWSESKQIIGGAWFRYFWRFIGIAILGGLVPSFIWWMVDKVIASILRNITFGSILYLVIYFVGQCAIQGFSSVVQARFVLDVVTEKPIAYFEHLTFSVDNIKDIFVAYIRVFLKVFLGMILVIPGIVFAMDYALVPYIIVKNPRLPAKEVCIKSKELMYGHRAQLFGLLLLLMLASVLSLLLLGIPMFYFWPHFIVAIGIFARDLTEQIQPLESVSDAQPLVESTE